MLRNIAVWSLLSCVCLMIFASGCSAPQARLQFDTGEKATYKMTTETRIDYKFDQPSAKKSDEKQTSTKVSMTYLQETEKVEEDGAAVAKITIKGITYLSAIKNKVNFDFDSGRKSDMKKPLAKLIGKGYKLKISPNGSVTVVDAKAIRKAVKRGQDSQIAKSLLANDRLIKHHTILAMPDDEVSTVTKGQIWERIEKSDPALKWAPKSYAKTYTVTKTAQKNNQHIIQIDMEAAESIKDAAGQNAPGMGAIAQIFDPEEKYSGQMILKDGKVESYNESFVGTYIAAEMPSGASADVEPDTLMMGFTKTISIEKLD